MGDEEIEVVEHFKYLGSLKSADGNCSKDTRSRIGKAKKRMLDLVPIWKDRGITKDLNMKLVRSLVRTVLTYGAEGWTLTKAGFESHCGKLRFGTLAIPFTPLRQCLSEETLKAVGPFYLVSMPGEVKDPTSPHWNV